MSKNEVSIFDPANVPAHITDFNQTESNIVARNNTDRISIKGKVFTVVMGGNKQTLMKKNEDGDDEPRQFIPVVILGYAARRGRAYYPDGYSDAAPKAPSCWSKDGIAPDKEVEEKQSAKCGECPMAKKGSKVTDNGQETKACSEHRFVAVQLYRKWDTPPLQLRLSITSDYDTRNKEQEAKGWYAFSQYTDMLRARGVKHTASVVTRLKFDPSSTHVKLMFSAVGWLTPEELELASPLAKSDEVQSLINPVFTIGTGESDKPLPKEDEEEDGPVEVTPPKPPKGAKAPAAPTKPAGTKKPKVVEPEPEAEEEEEEEVVEGEVVTEGGENATEVGDIVEETEEEDEDPGVVAAQKALDAQKKAAAKKKADAEAAAKAAQARKAGAGEEGEEDDAPIVVAPAKPPKGTPAAPPAGKVTAGKTSAAPKGTPAGKPAKASAEVGAIIDEW